MAVSTNLKELVNSEERNLDDIRDSLFFAATKDPGFKAGGDFELSLKFCLENGISESDLFQTDDGREIPTEVNEENYSTICASLRTNFSKEKLAVAKKMGKILYPEETGDVKKKATLQSSTTRTVRRTEKRNSPSGRTVGSRNPEKNKIPTWAIIAAAFTVFAVGVGVGVAIGHAIFSRKF